jgi:hypothetical protein
MLTSSIELTWVQEVEDAAALASTHQDVEGLVRKVTLLEGELTEARWDREVTEEKFCSLTNTSADGVLWLVVSEMEHREQVEELSLLQARGIELCLAIVCP